MTDLSMLAGRAQLAARNGEAPEVVHDLLIDLALALEAAGLPEAAAVRRSATTLVPMFGLGEERQARSPRRQRVVIDHDARIAHYRRSS